MEQASERAERSKAEDRRGKREMERMMKMFIEFSIKFVIFEVKEFMNKD